jgi:hypothetical protein
MYRRKRNRNESATVPADVFSIQTESGSDAFPEIQYSSRYEISTRDYPTSFEFWTDNSESTQYEC